MAKGTVSVKTPNDILGELVNHPTVVSDELLLEHLENARSVLPALSKPQYERCVPDELAGTIATIIGMVCVNHSDTPVVMVTSFADQKAYSLMLKKAVAALRKLGHLPAGYDVTVKHNKQNYFCRKRFENACANGIDYPDSISQYLTVDRLNRFDAKKLHVQACSISCKHYETCKYQLLLAHLSAGDAKLQVYDEQQYRSALNANRLPKARLAVYSPRGRRVLTEDGVRILTEAELNKLLAWCEKDCSKLIRHKKLVYKEAASIRRHADNLFAMATYGVDEETARQHLASIVCSLKAIRVDCIKQLKKPEKSGLLKSLEKTIAKGTAMLEQTLSVTHKNQGKKALVTA